jgi:hypothetical protein
MRFAGYQRFDPSENDDDRNSKVGAPRKPTPALRNSSVARRSQQAATVQSDVDHR